ncbi:MAG: hypothetical protein GXP55_24690 [Deltaproteobacteria bacterium]|nr:hypothetical protein [Deltaproteobacteria bacterium]
MKTSANTDAKRIWIGLGIAFLAVIMLIGVCGGIGAFSYAFTKGFKRAVEGSRTPAEPVYRTPSDDELLGFGQQLQEQLVAGDWAAVDDQMDWPAFEARTSAAMTTPARRALATGGVTGMRSRGFSVVMNGGQPNDSLFSFRGVFPRDGVSRLRFRRVARQGGFQFVELLVRARPDTDPRVIDAWSINTGEDLSSTLAEALGGVRAANPSLLRRLGGQRNPWTTHGEELRRAQTLMADGRAEEALALLDALPQVMRDSRLVSLLRVKAAAATAPERYAAVLDEVAALRPDDPAVLVMLIDRHALAEQWAEAAADIQRIQLFLPDPYLDTVQARMEERAGHVERALTLIEAAQTAEPELLDVHDVRMLIALRQGDMAVADRELGILIRRFNVNAEQLAAMDGYAQIRALPSFATPAP